MTVDDVAVLTRGPSHFGFHDLTPWNCATEELICLRTSIDEDHVPTKDDEAEIVIVSETSGQITPIALTRAWNWQKGARQRWLPALGRRVIAYNAANAHDFECRIHDLEANTERILPQPLYDICDEAGFGLSLNFRRLHRHQPGYGYDHPTPEPKFDYESEGICRIDLATGKQDLALSIASFLREHSIEPGLGEHYFTHVQISPNGERFVFIHRCFLPSGALINHFVVAKSDGSETKILLDDKMSHFDWKGNDQVVVWCRQNRAAKNLKESKFVGIARPLYRLSRKIRAKTIRQGIYNECFRQIDVNTKVAVPIGKGVLTEDGHPQINPCFPDIWINDTYPDKKNEMTLMLYNQQTNERCDLLQLQTQPQLKETTWRCDLHPRWHPSGTKICFDSAHLSRRQLCVLDVTKYIDQMLD